MRRTDYQAVTQDGLLRHWTGFPTLSGLWGRVDHGSAEHPSGDLAEESPSGWESCWIDLGGEG